jgi:hypothetical protein
MNGNTSNAGGMQTGRIIDGVIRAARLDKSFYAEVEKDTSYSTDALIIVIAVSVLGAVGAFLGTLIGGGGFLRAIGTFIWGVVWGVAAYYLLSFIISWVGTSFFKGQGDMGEVQRCLGFAYAPRLLSILAVIPCIGWIAALAGWIWSAVMGFVAIREALDQDTTNAVLTVVVSFVAVIVIGLVIGGILGRIGLSGSVL